MNAKHPKYDEVRNRAREIHETIFPEDSRPLTDEEPCPFPVDDEEFPPREEPDHPGDLLPLECVRDLGQVKPDRRIELLRRCPHMPDPFDREILDIADALGSPPQWDVSEKFRWKFDRCAWYRPIHYYGPDFGIVMRRRCLLKIARGIALTVDPTELDGALADHAMHCLLGAFYGLQLHEFYHHKTESLGVRLRVVERRPRDIPPYVRYMQQVYRNYWPNLLEESLANAYSYRQLAQLPYRDAVPGPIQKATRAFLKKSFAVQRGGYRDALLYLTPTAFTEGEWDLQETVSGVGHAHRDARQWRDAPDMMRSLFLVREVPVFLV